MSEHIKPDDQALWDVLTDPLDTEESKPLKKSRPKFGPRFASQAPVKDVPAAPNRKLDGFFFACMAGVAAVSVAATLMFSGMTGKTAGNGTVNGPIGSNAPTASTAPLAGQPDLDALQALEQENEQLRQQLELQKQQIISLQAQILDLNDGTATLPTDSSENAPQMEAYEIFKQIQAAYADFDRETLETLIPEMDKRLTYLGSDALLEYYMILEYVEQPSNG